MNPLNYLALVIRHATLCPFLLFATLLITNVSRSQSASFDTSFNGTGYVLEQLSAVQSTKFQETQFEAGITQPNGKIIAAGNASVTADNPVASDFLLVRYNPDGKLDPSFGTSGIALTDLGGTADRILAVALQPDGKIIAAGSVQEPGESSTRSVVARYNSDGSLDPSFGNAGIYIIPLESVNHLIQDVVVQPDNKIVLAGTTYLPRIDFLLFRLNTNGTLDAGFGDRGKVITHIRDFDLGTSVALQPDGKILMTGDAGPDIALLRFNSDGSPDNIFGNSGRIITDINGSADGGRSVVWHENKIFVAGFSTLQGSTAPKTAPVLLRFNADGTPDQSFGAYGRTTTDFGPGSSHFFDIVIHNGKILGAGATAKDATQAPQIDFDFALAQFLGDGQIDTSFGLSGKVVSDFSNGSGQRSADHAEAAIFHNNTIYVFGQAARFTGPETFKRYGVVAAYKSDRFAGCYIDQISDLTATPDNIWPPNKKMVEVTLNYNVTGNCPADLAVTVTSNESSAKVGRDWQIIDDHHVLVRADKRSDGGNRVYTIAVSGPKASGETIYKRVNVSVAKPGKQGSNAAVETDDERAPGKFSIKVLSNPTPTSFKVYVGNNGSADVTISDSYGRVIDRMVQRPGGAVLEFGNRYQPGIYFISVTQGQQRKNIKLIKTAR